MSIQTHVSSYDKSEPKPKSLKRDSRGTLIEPGLRVAYNYSGDVVIGKIQKISKNEWKEDKGWGWRLYFEILIENEEGHVSKVKNPNSFVII